jgi:DNA repair exonuclease SbcCD ATPase subunit
MLSHTPFWKLPTSNGDAAMSDLAKSLREWATIEDCAGTAMALKEAAGAIDALERRVRELELEMTNGDLAAYQAACARAEAAEAALATARRKLEARKTMLHVANAMWKSAQGEVEKQNAQLREMREALKAWVNDFEDHTDSHPEWVLNHYRRARAALASQPDMKTKSTKGPITDQMSNLVNDLNGGATEIGPVAKRRMG